MTEVVLMSRLSLGASEPPCIHASLTVSSLFSVLSCSALVAFSSHHFHSLKFYCVNAELQPTVCITPRPC